MFGTVVLKAFADLESYYARFDRHLGRPENREHARLFARGQLGPIERKSLEPIADAEGVNPRALQYFFSQGAWDECGVRDELQRQVKERYGGPDGIFIVDETSDAKKGESTAGIARQYCGEMGKIENCIVSVHLTYACGDFHSLVDGELFLPDCWDSSSALPGVADKRLRAEIPDDVGHVSKAEMALGQLRRARANGLPGKYLTADEGYGGKPWWRDGVADLGLSYVVEVPLSTMGWVGEPDMKVPEWKGRGPTPTKARPQLKALTVEELVASARGLRFQPWQMFKVHDTHKGPDVWEFKATHSFYEQRDGLPGSVQWLLIGRNIRTGELKYFLSNGPPNISIEVLICVAFSRWRVERCFQDCKTELGLNHAELRTYAGISRHLILTAVNYFFMQDWIRAQTPDNSLSDLTVSQFANAIQSILNAKTDGVMSDPQIQRLADGLAEKITITQQRNRRARVSATARRIRELAAMGIDCQRLRSCCVEDVSL